MGVDCSLPSQAWLSLTSNTWISQKFHSHVPSGALLPLPQLLWTPGPAWNRSGCSIPAILQSHPRWSAQLTTDTGVWLELRAERTLTQQQNQRKVCSKKALSMWAQNIPMGTYCQWQRHLTFPMRKMTFPFTHPWSCHSCGFIFHPDWQENYVQ